MIYVHILKEPFGVLSFFDEDKARKALPDPERYESTLIIDRNNVTEEKWSKQQ